MQIIDAVQLGSNAWVLLAIAIAFLLAVFACSVFSLQLCMAYFGEEVPTYPGTVGLKLKIIIACLATLFVGYAFLGSFYILTAPLAFFIALSMIAQSARCDRFFAAVITLSHGACSTLATGLCAFVFWIGLSATGVDVMSVASDVYISTASHTEDGYYTPGESHFRRRNVSHTNPFLEADENSAAPSTAAAEETEDQG